MGGKNEREEKRAEGKIRKERKGRRVP